MTRQLICNSSLILFRLLSLLSYLIIVVSRSSLYMMSGLQKNFGKTCENNSTMKQIEPKMTHARIHNSNLWWQTSDNHLSEVDWGHAWLWSKWVFQTTKLSPPSSHYQCTLSLYQSINLIFSILPILLSETFMKMQNKPRTKGGNLEFLVRHQSNS